MRSGLRMLLDAEADFEVVAEAGDIPTLLQEAGAEGPGGRDSSGGGAGNRRRRLAVG
jgi:hypothetical protein